MHRRRTPRGLRPEERELWRVVADSTRPMIARPPIPAKGEPVKPAPRDEMPAVFTPTPAPPIAPFRVGAKAPSIRPMFGVASPPDRTPADMPRQMDRKAFARLSRGKLTPEARIDLHGMTLAEAQPALARFILSAQAAGLRLVLVITGKGRRGADEGPIPRRTGALRHEVPQWLAQPPLSAAVIQVAQAHLRHGGQGAYYVYLRKTPRNQRAD